MPCVPPGHYKPSEARLTLCRMAPCKMDRRCPKPMALFFTHCGWLNHCPLHCTRYLGLVAFCKAGGIECRAFGFQPPLPEGYGPRAFWPPSLPLTTGSGKIFPYLIKTKTDSINQAVLKDPGPGSLKHLETQTVTDAFYPSTGNKLPSSEQIKSPPWTVSGQENGVCVN